MTTYDTDTLYNLLARFMRIDDVTTGELSSGYLFRYRGQLLHIDTAPAYDELAVALKPHGLMPLFRKGEAGMPHIVLLIPARPDPQPLNPTLNIVLFLLTVVTVMMVGIELPPDVPLPANEGEAFQLMFRYIYTGWPFALAMLGILLTHEFGHFFAAKYHKTDASLPYFIPFPSLLGTMGAVIVQREIPRNKRVMFDIGVAGPLAGLVVAIPVLLYGLTLSKLGPIEPSPNGFIEGNSLLYLAAKYLVFGQLLPAPADYHGLPPLLYWLAYFFTGAPSPIGGTDVFIHPIAMAGWGGLLVTALNLIPAGQLDGGHILYGLFGKNTSKARPFILAILVVMGFFWNGWWLWAGLVYFFGRNHPEVHDEITELDLRRRALAWLMILVFFLVFIPVPLTLLAP